MTLSLSITSAGVKEGTTEFSEYWRTTFPSTTTLTETREEETEEDKKASIKPYDFIVGTNIIASIERLDNNPIDENVTIVIGNFHIDDYWIDSDGIAYFVPPKTLSNFNTNEVTIGNETFDTSNEISTVSDPKESIKSLENQLDLLHTLSDLPIGNGMENSKSVKDQLLKEGYYRFQLALNDLQNKFSDFESNKVLSDEISKVF
ncbi:hypothetical protein F0000_10595 [Aquimarina sp. RZ0]|nr:hypothetical protein F0000_10595 [Aquimarina sp. RZ0]